MKQVEKTGRTVEEAIDLALGELNVSKDKANIEVLDEGNKGVFGLFGGKECKVRVTAQSETEERAKTFLNNVFAAMNMPVTMDFNENAEALEISLGGEGMGVLIGRRGENLDALQYLVSIVVNRGDQEFVRVILDSENYRQKRKDTLVKLANRLAARVARDRKNITLEPMNPYERRIIHSALQDNKYVETGSVGDEPNRRIVISYKK